MTDKKYLSLLLLICALVIALMLPLQNSVFSDDVAFSQSVRHFVQTGDLKVSEYTAASSITHILWGSIFVKLLGFSLSALNLSVVVLLPVLLLSFYKILRYLNISKSKSFIFTLFFLSISWIIFLTFTFMSDIPFLVLEMLSIQFYLKFTKEKNTGYLALSLIFASAAFLMRQLGLVLIIGAVISCLVEVKFSLKKVKLLFLPIFIPILLVAFYQLWLLVPGNKTIPQYVYEAQTRNDFKNFIPFSNVELGIRLDSFSRYIHRILTYLSQAMGLMFPLLAVIILSNIGEIRRTIKRNYKVIILSSAIAGMIYFLDVVSFRKDYTVGFPLMIYEYESFLPIPWPHVWKYMVIFSIPFWFSQITYSILRVKRIPEANNLYLLITFFGILFMTATTFHSWDRYLLPLLPFAFFYLAKVTNKYRLNKALAYIVTAILIIDSIQMTKLRCSETGLLYSIGNQLVKNGVEPSTIDLNRDQGWDIWYYFEKGIQKEINNVHGDKTKIENFQRFPLPAKKIKYGIYTDRMIKYQNLNVNYAKATIIPFKSLFLSSKLTFLNY